MKTFIIVLAIVLLGIGVYYYSSKNKPAPTTTTESGMMPATGQDASTSTSPAAPVTGQSVSIANFAFSPAGLSVAAGQTVIWTNNDSVPHTVTSDSGTELDSGPIAPGASWSHTFAAAGTYSYHCAIHPMMKGSVTVN